MLRSATNAVISLGLVSVIWFSLAPLFGLTARGSRRSSTSDYIYSYPYPTTGGAGYYDYSDAGYQYDGYNYAQGRSLDLGQEENAKPGIFARVAKKLVDRWGGGL